jgi:hypothetical protein
MTPVMDAGSQYLERLAQGDADGAAALFAHVADLDVPVAGRVTGDTALKFLREAARGLKSRNTRIELLRRTASGTRAVREAILHGDNVSLPVAVVAQHSEAGGLVELRVYYSTWALYGKPKVRPPTLKLDARIALPDVIAKYQAALAAGDVDAVVSCFEERGIAREPAGGPHIHHGRAGLKQFYTALFSRGGGIPLGHCAVTDDGVACALEYVVTKWGRHNLQPQAGIAVYERGQSGLLAAARNYDDAAPPP